MHTRALVLAAAAAMLMFLTACAEAPRSADGAASSALEAQVPGDFATIQAAIDAASPGDVVVLGAQAYQEDLVLAEGVTVRGAGRSMTILYGTVSTGGSVGGLADLTLDGGLSGAGAVGVTAGDSGLAIDRVSVTGFSGAGVVVEGSAVEPTRIDRVEITQCGGDGLVVEGASGLEVANTIVSFNAGRGVRVSGGGAPQPTFAHLLLLANGHGTGAAGFELSSGAGLLVNSIVTGNYVGVTCGAACTAHHNIVWGNGSDWGGQAGPGIGDVALDPGLVAPGDGDYHLTATSPALDSAAAELAPAHDFEGTPRPQGSAADIGPYERPAHGAAGPGVVINEVMANALNEATGEYVELYNASTSSVDVAGWILDDGDDTDVIEGWAGGPAIIPAFGYAVVLDPGYPGDTYDIPLGATYLTVGNAKLGSGLSTSDPVTVSTADGTVVDTFSYPQDPGNGVSIEKDSVEDGDIATNWVPSPCGQTPGRMNCASGLAIGGVDVIVNEVMANPLDEATGEFIELLNVGNGAIDLAGHTLSDGDSSDVLTGLDGGATVLAPGQLAVVLDPGYAGQYMLGEGALLLTIASSATLGNGLSNDDPITLAGPDGTTLDQLGQPFDAGDGVSMERAAPQQGGFVASTCSSGSSPGSENCASLPAPGGGGGPMTIVITEVMANALDEDTGEFVELYNVGDAPVDVAGWRIDDGDKEEPLQAFGPGGTEIPAGGFALVLDAEFAGDYELPGAAVLLRTPDTSTASGLGLEDPITLRGPTGAAPVATFHFPFNPGNGVSAQRVDVAAGDVPGNWIASPCGASPGALTCDDEPPPPAGATLTIAGLVISEVLANPLSESTGELIELYNAGPAAVDLDGLLFSDGDATDTLEAFGAGGPTVLEPGGYAVVLDQDYVGDHDLSGAVLLTVDDASLGNGLATNDPVSVLDPVSGVALATFSFPANPGNGRSIERLTAAGGDVAGNWTPSPCDASPGQKNCADGSAEPTGTRADGEPCPNGGADCAGGLCAVDVLAGEWLCASPCSGGCACVETASADWPEVCLEGDGGAPGPPPVLINELSVDGPGSDVDVFVELAGPPGTVLDGLQLVGINGGNGDPYKVVPLAGQLDEAGYFVVAHPSAPEPVFGAADMLTVSIDFQNGPDSVQLVAADGTVLDAVGYGDFDSGAIFAGEGTPAVDQPPGLTLSRVPDQTDTDDNGADFALADRTPGAANQLSTLPTPTIGEVLITEVRVSPTAAEFVELHNPGGSAVDLSYVYIADYPGYYQVTSGGGAPSSADFRLRFPAGTTLLPGQYVTVSLETAAHFQSEYQGANPDFDLSASIQAAPAMAGEYTGSASLSNTHEMLVVFYWDGASDVVTDLDYISWGNDTSQKMDKTGVASGAGAYAAETAVGDQDTPQPPGDGALSRCDLSEGAEETSGGNGVGGEDETSEDFSATFQLLFPPTPGEANICYTPCTPDCGGATCGGDGCGGTCGACVASQICDQGACLTPEGPLLVTPVTGFELPAALHDVQTVELLTSAAAFQDYFGAPAPAGVDFSGQWLVFYSEGKRNTPGHIVTVNDIVDDGDPLLVLTEFQVPGEACEVLELTLPTWTLVSFPKPASGASAVTHVPSEIEFDCATSGAVLGDNCSPKKLCGADLICSGTTLNYGLCFPSWMHKVFEKPGTVAIPDGAPSGVTLPIEIAGLATVEMDVILKIDVTHPDPSELTITVFYPYNCEGDPTQWVVAWDQAPADGPDLHLHLPLIGFSGDAYVNGGWSVQVIDHAAGASGAVDFFSLEFTSRWD